MSSVYARFARRLGSQRACVKEDKCDVMHRRCGGTRPEKNIPRTADCNGYLTLLILQARARWHLHHIIEAHDVLALATKIFPWEGNIHSSALRMGGNQPSFIGVRQFVGVASGSP